MLYANNQDASTLAHVQLLARVRPLLASDHVLPTSYLQLDPSQGNIILGGNRIFQVDNVLPFDAPQSFMYSGYVEPFINACFEGYNISIIAFGQTGSGKTYAVFGPGLLYAMNEEDFGIVPRAVRHIFYKLKDYPERHFTIHVSYLEIYHEEIRDLLSAEPFHGEITLQEDSNGDILLQGATQMECQTIHDVFSCLETGLALRHTGPMMMNQLSSRSHGIFTLYIQQAWTQDGCLYEIRSKLHFVDLAGSERLSGTNGLTSGNGTGFQEPFPINSGLLALSNVTAALGDPRRKANHVPYWDSKLTCILKDSLGGNALTLLIVCISPSASDLEETMNTLKFATRAANIVNRPVFNLRITPIASLHMASTNNAKHFIPIGAPAHLYPPPYGSAQSNGPYINQESQDSNISIEQNKDEAEEESNVEDELFKLRFAAGQWEQLVTNAESLLNELVAIGNISEDIRNRIESWLCLKEEYQHCIDPDLYAIKPRCSKRKASLARNITVDNETNKFRGTADNKTLHVIEEVSEPTPTREICSTASEGSYSSTVTSSDGSHFTERLDNLRQKFQETTDRLINNIEMQCDVILTDEMSEKMLPVELNQIEDSNQDMENISSYTNKRPSITAPNSGRRVSIFGFTNGVDTDALVAIKESVRDSGSSSSQILASEDDESKREHYACNSEPEDDLQKEMRRLSETSESRRAQVRQTNKQLKKAQQTLKELRKAIKLKEAFINEITQAGLESEMSKRKFEEKIEKLELDAAQTRMDLAAAQVRLRDLEEQAHKVRKSQEENEENNTKDNDENHQRLIERHQREIARYETKLRDMAKLLDLTGRGPRKVGELERSLSAMKEQQLLLKEQLRQENERKKKLQEELENDHKRIIELERQLRDRRRLRCTSPTDFRIDTFSDKEGSNVDSELEHKWKWLVAEEERLEELRTSIQRQSEELEAKQLLVEKREKAILDKVSKSADGIDSALGSELGARRKKTLEAEDKMIQTSTCICQSLNASNQKNGDGDRLEASQDSNAAVDKEAIRKEIRNLRHTRDSLVHQRQGLDERQHRGRELDAVEERRLLELDEAIEAVDAAIEYKNEVLCNRPQELKSPTEDGLLTRLMSLSHAETRSLLCKYFHKVIDLRDGSKKMEQQFAELEAQYEDQSRYVRELSTALKHTQLEVERRLIPQRNHDHKISNTLRQLDDGSSASSSVVERKLKMLHEELNHRDNRDLRRHLKDLLSVTPKQRPANITPVAIATDASPSACSSRTPSLLGLHAVQALHEKIQGLQRLKGRQTGPATTTTVTREKNKLIIKQQPVQQETRETKRRLR